MLLQPTSNFKHICGGQFWASLDIQISVPPVCMYSFLWPSYPRAFSCTSGVIHWNSVQSWKCVVCIKCAWPCQPSAIRGRRGQRAAQLPAPGERHLGAWFSGGLLRDAALTANNSNTSGTPPTAFPPSVPYTTSPPLLFLPGNTFPIDSQGLTHPWLCFQQIPNQDAL